MIEIYKIQELLNELLTKFIFGDDDQMFEQNYNIYSETNDINNILKGNISIFKGREIDTIHPQDEKGYEFMKHDFNINSIMNNFKFININKNKFQNYESYYWDFEININEMFVCCINKGLLGIFMETGLIISEEIKKEYEWATDSNELGLL